MNDTRIKDVYFTQAEESGMIKIGHSIHPRIRKYDLQVGNPEKLLILGCIRETEELTERIIHRRFQHCRKSGEWFYPETDLLDYIRTLPGYGSFAPPDRAMMFVKVAMFNGQFRQLRSEVKKLKPNSNLRGTYISKQRKGLLRIIEEARQLLRGFEACRDGYLFHGGDDRQHRLSPYHVEDINRYYREVITEARRKLRVLNSKIIEANGFAVYHRPGGCEAWTKPWNQLYSAGPPWGWYEELASWKVLKKFFTRKIFLHPPADVIVLFHRTLFVEGYEEKCLSKEIILDKGLWHELQELYKDDEEDDNRQMEFFS